MHLRSANRNEESSSEDTNNIGSDTEPENETHGMSDLVLNEHRLPIKDVLCSICKKYLDEEPTIIRCDANSCKRLFHPSCLGNSAPLCNELWFCSPCQDSVVIEPAVNQVNTADEVCSICQRRVEDSDCGLQCDICDTWKHCTCLGISDDQYDCLINSAENFYCPSCSVGGFCGVCGLLIDKTLDLTLIRSCKSSCDRKFHVSCIDPPNSQCRVDQNDTSGSYWECPDCHIQPHIPSFVGSNEDLVRVKWHGLHGRVLFDTVNETYEEVIKWKRNLFKVPTGKAGQDFVAELSNCLKHFSSGTSLQPIALKMAMITFPLLLQKPSKKSKAKDHTKYLSKRLELWKEGNLSAIVHEGKEIQKRLVSSKNNSADNTDKIFVRLMLQGKVSAALRWIGSSKTSVRTTDDETVSILKALHPDAADTSNVAMLRGPVDKVEHVIFDSIDADMIQSVIKHISGAAGPSGADAELWLHILCTKQLKKKPQELCETIAECAKKMATTLIDPDHLVAFTACRLVPLNKNPSGVRPIGIGEILHRIIGKAIVRAINQDIVEATAPIQVCAGIPGGVEAAVHAARSIFNEDKTEAILLVDAANAFNALNRKAALHNIQLTCPELSTYVINTYRKPAHLHVAGSETPILSQEGTTQGDVPALGIYSCATIPLVRYQVLQSERMP